MRNDNPYTVSILIGTPDGRRVQYDMALEPHELHCLEPLPSFPDDPSAAFAAIAQLEARGRLAKRIGQVAAENACDVIEAIHADRGEPTRGTIERMRAETRMSPVYARFGAGRY